MTTSSSDNEVVRDHQDNEAMHRQTAAPIPHNKRKPTGEEGQCVATVRKKQQKVCREEVSQKFPSMEGGGYRANFQPAPFSGEALSLGTGGRRSSSTSCDDNARNERGIVGEIGPSFSLLPSRTIMSEGTNVDSLGWNTFFTKQRRSPRETTFIPLVRAMDLSDYNGDISEKQCLDAWISSFNEEQTGFDTLAEYCEHKLQEAVQASNQLGTPNAFRTAVTCALLCKVCGQFDRYGNILAKLRTELFASIYKDSDKLLRGSGSLRTAPVSLTAREFFERFTYFEDVRALMQRRRALLLEIRMYRKQKKKMELELERKEKVLNTTTARWKKTLMQQTLRMWHKIVQTIKRQKSLLTQYFLRQKRRNLRHILREWRLYVEQIKQQRTQTSIGAAQTKHAQMESTEQKLKEELKAHLDEKASLERVLQRAKDELSALERAHKDLLRQIGEVQEAESHERCVAREDMCQYITTDAFQALKARMREVAAMPCVDLTLLVGIGPEIDEDLVARIEKGRTREGGGKKGSGKGGGKTSARERSKGKGVSVEEQVAYLYDLPGDLVLLKWFNFQLLGAGSSNLVENFGSELKDSEELATLLSRCSESYNSPVRLPEKLKDEDVEARAHTVTVRANKLGCPPITSVSSIINEVADLNMGLVAYLFCTYPYLVPKKDVLSEAMEQVSRAERLWEQLTSRWADKPIGVKRAEIIETGRTVMLAIEAGEHALKKREEQMNFWPKMREKIKIYGWHHLLQRSRGKPVVMIDRKELRQELAFTERVIQSDDWLKTKLGGREEQEEMLRVLKHYYQSLKKTYRHYGSSEKGSGTMDYNEFSTLIKDSRLISKSLSISDIQMIFFEANEEDVRGEASNPDFELMAHEFVEGLIRLSDKVRSDESHRQGAALSGEGGAGGVTEGDAGEGTKRDVHRERQDKASKYPLVCSSVLCRDFMWVMENHVLKFGCKSTTDEWRQALNTRQTKDVFRKHRERLQRMFRRYCGDDRTMDVEEFKRLMRSKHLIDEGFTEAEMQMVFKRVQDDEDAVDAAAGAQDGEEGGAEEGGQQLTYQEFLEGLAVVAVYKEPDPYLPVSDKIDDFIENSILVTEQ